MRLWNRKKDVSAGTGGRRFGRRLCAEVCHAGYECDHRAGKAGRRSGFRTDPCGQKFSEIEEVYNRSQEKFLDLGHLQVVILDESMLTEENRKAFLEYLKQEEHVGEDVYMFRPECWERFFTGREQRKVLWVNIFRESRRTVLPGSRKRSDFERGISSVLPGRNITMDSFCMGKWGSSGSGLWKC